MHWKRSLGAALFAVTMTAGSAAAQFGGNFGSSAAIGDGEFFVGEPHNTYSPGVVYVYRMDGGTWKAASELTAADASNNDSFGRSIAANGNTLLIGATTVGNDAGAAYIFQKTGNAWKQAARLNATGLSKGDALGRAVALKGDLALVASWGADSGRGAVYAFRRGAGGWTQEGRLSAPDGESGDFFGSALAIGNDKVFIGAMSKDSARGAIYVFKRDAGTWSQDTVLQVRGIDANSRLGSSLHFEDGMLLAGAPGYNRNAGGVAIFKADSASGAWQLVDRLQPFDPGFLQFGTNVSVNGDEVWVAAPGANNRNGAIYRFQRDDAGHFTSATKLSPGGLPARAGFSAPLVLRGNLAVVGASGVDYGEGAAITLTKSGNDWTAGPMLKSEPRSLAAVTGKEIDCAGKGSASIFDCQDVDMLSFLPVSAIGGVRGAFLNDIWGWTDSQTKKEYALVGRMDGTSFVDVTDPMHPQYLGNLPMTEGAIANAWRDIKVYKNYAFIVADGAGDHGMQVFNLTRLRNVRGQPVTFTEDAHYDRIHSSHNIVIDTSTGFAYSVGSGSGGETCGGGLHMIDIRNPTQPKFAGCYANPNTGRAGTGYTHDAQCVIYKGPDKRYTGREICLGANETALDIADVTDKKNPKTIAKASYPNVGYTHQGWLSEDQRYFYMDDELDELQGFVNGTRTLVWDLAELDDPVLAKEYISEDKASDHNLYVKGNLVFQSNYVSGLRILDISDPTNPVQVGYFDTVPVGEDAPGFGGSWSNYPYFPSGTVVVTSMKEGLFMLRKHKKTLVP